LPHLPYAPPPPQDRLLPEQLTVDTLAHDAQGKLAAHLGQRIAGLSPQAARELAFRATGSVDTPVSGADWPVVLGAIHSFFEPVDTHVWEPTLALREEQPVAYAPYRLEHMAAAGAELRDVTSISVAMDAYYAHAQTEPAPRGDLLAGERPALLAQLERDANSVARRISALQHQLDSGHAQRDNLRRAGELILTHQSALPPGASELTIDGETISLDRTLSASENAQAYFARYRKAREAEERVPLLLEEARQQAAHLLELRTLVDVAQDMNAIRALRREVRGGADKPGKHGRPAPKGAPHRRVGVGDGWEALIGSSAAGNAAVTFDLAAADDLWLHARGVPGAHVVLRGQGSAEPPPSVIERAAELAAWHSAARTAGRVEVDVAPRRHVRKIPNAPPGLVRYSNERTLRVEPRA
jgi:predicted ribosome quality control (RQC) complex YloA/Tae2 family protein